MWIATSLLTILLEDFCLREMDDFTQRMERAMNERKYPLSLFIAGFLMNMFTRFFGIFAISVIELNDEEN